MNENFEEEEFNIWPTYSDVSFAIVLILLFAILAQYIVIGKVLEINKISKEQDSLSLMLQEAFPEDYGTTIRDTSQPQLQKIIFTNQILFDSGSDRIKSRGKEILKGIVTIINQLDTSDFKAFDEIQVRGHTDDRAITHSAIKAKFPTNWELSSARAIAVVRFFVEECDFIPDKDLLLSAQGYSKFDYIKENLSNEDRALNRRIEIVIKYPLSY